MKNKYLIIYHKEDNDGVFSGALAYNYVKEYLGKTDIVLFGTEYNELNKLWTSGEVYNWEYDNIIMTDISFNSFNSQYSSQYLMISSYVVIFIQSPLLLQLELQQLYENHSFQFHH